MTLPLLADFALRLAGGMAAMLLIAPWRVVPPAFFRTHCQVILGLAVLAGLVEGPGGPSLGLAATIGTAALAFLASVGWGLGLARIALPLTAAIAAACAALLAWASWDADPVRFVLGNMGRLSSSALLGSTLTAMLLGHHYLTVPAMSIDPLRRFVAVMAGSLAVRVVVAAAGLAWGLGTTATGGSDGLLLAIRWGMGIGGPALATYLAWRTVQIRSTQSATGILYIAMTLVLFGELTAMILGRDAARFF